MTYENFLEKCREFTAAREKADISKSEFARRLGFKKPAHYIRVSNGKQLPGRELLEKAAELAGLDFKDCISIPAASGKPSEEEKWIAEFKKAAYDDRKAAARFAYEQLKKMKRP